ncbi:hypothetical protein ACQBAU_05585 [Propionibacteriaceae bacterium Y2011]
MTTSLATQRGQGSTTGTTDPAPRRTTWQGVATVLLCAVPVLFVMAVGWRQRWVSDDGWINLRVVDQFFAGNGLVFSAGERVEVTTSTLWLWLLIAGQAVTRGPEYGLVAVVLGVVLSGFGVAVGLDAARRAWRFAFGGDPGTRHWFLLPIGAIGFVALPPVWDFVTSGLETGLIFAWLGGCWWLLVRTLERRPAGPVPLRHVVAPAVVIGLGPLIRPDLALVAGCFGLALLLVQGWARGRALLTIGVAALLPLGWEVFRAGYYATLVPNTALAKSAGSSSLARGLDYLADLALRYWVIVPVVLALVAASLLGRRLWRRSGLPGVAVVAAPVVGAGLHAAYVTYVGGDFMHGRLLLPATMAILLPGFAAPLVRLRQPVAALLCASTLAWAAIAALPVRTTYDVGWDPRTGIANERAFWWHRAGSSMVTMGDLANLDRAKFGLRVRAEADAGRRYYWTRGRELPVADGFDVVVEHGNLGVVGMTAGPAVYLADPYALADPIGARLSGPGAVVSLDRQRPGHTERPPVWRRARFVAPDPNDEQALRDARAALQCGELAELQQALHDPMTPGRFGRNLLLATGFTIMAIPADPTEARMVFCD